MGKACQHLCNIKAIKLLLEHYKDKQTQETVISSLKLIDESTNLKTLGSRANRYQTILSKDAKSVYGNIVHSKLFI